MPRKLPYVSVSPEGDIVIIPANKQFAAIILRDDYEEWRKDPLGVASYVLESRVQIDLMVTAIEADADLNVEDEAKLVFRFPNGLRLAVPLFETEAGLEIDSSHDFIALPEIVLHCEVTVEYGSAANDADGVQHGKN